MKKIFALMACVALATSCRKDPVELPLTTATTITATVSKVSLTDSVGIFVYHPYTLAPGDTSHFTGNISWGDGNFTIIDNPATGPMNVFHKYVSTGVYPIVVTLNKPTVVSTLTIFFQGVGQLDTLLSLTGLTGMPRMYVLNLQGDKLQTPIDISGLPAMSYMWLRGNALSTSAINSILVSLDNETGIPASPIPYIQIDKQTPLQA
jgi:hypothetical protein